MQTHIEFVTRDGILQQVSYADSKALCLASEPGPPDLFTSRNLFERRPKAAGLWARFTLRDGSLLDGLLPHSLLEWPESGFWIVPPHAGAARQRVFLPRLAVANTELLGVMAAAKPKLVSKVEDANQLKMFD